MYNSATWDVKTRYMDISPAVQPCAVAACTLLEFLAVVPSPGPVGASLTPNLTLTGTIKAAFLMSFQRAWLHFLATTLFVTLRPPITCLGDLTPTRRSELQGLAVMLVSRHANFVRQSPHRSARFGRSVRFGVNAPLFFSSSSSPPFSFLALPPFFLYTLHLRPPLCCHLLPKLCPTHQTGCFLCHSQPWKAEYNPEEAPGNGGTRMAVLVGGWGEKNWGGEGRLR